MLKVLGDAYVAADTGQVTLLSLLDLSAAFDTVDHPALYASNSFRTAVYLFMPMLTTFRSTVTSTQPSK